MSVWAEIPNRTVLRYGEDDRRESDLISTRVKSSNLSRHLLIHQKFIVMSKKVTTSSPKLFIGINIHNLSRHQAGRRVMIERFCTNR